MPDPTPAPDPDAPDEGEGEDLGDTLALLRSVKGARVPAPETFTRSVEETIHRRSAGRFFGRKTLGDRVPFGVLLIVAMAVLVATAAVLWSSQTGSLRLRDGGSRPDLAPGAGEALQQP